METGSRPPATGSDLRFGVGVCKRGLAWRVVGQVGEQLACPKLGRCGLVEPPIAWNVGYYQPAHGQVSCHSAWFAEWSFIAAFALLGPTVRRRC